MKAKFIGQNGSMGFEKGEIYTIETEIGEIEGFRNKKIALWVHTSNGLKCPYDNLERMLENWELLT